MPNAVFLQRPKLTEVATTRITDECMQMIDAQTMNRAEWFREAIEEKLNKSGEFYLSQKLRHESKNTLITWDTSKNTNVFIEILKLLKKPQAQKKTDGRRSLSAYSPKG